MSRRPKAEPFLRWAGGKRWLADRLVPALASVLAATGGRYHEPFVGSGALFFALLPSSASLADLNHDLVATFQAVQEDHSTVLDHLKRWEPTKETFLHVRGLETRDPSESAARFLYLNRTCYGGIYRTDRAGRFNTPFGGGSRNASVLWRRHVLEKASLALHADVSVSLRDFEKSIADAVFGDLVVCDPPYVDETRTQFDRYGSRIFSWDDQRRLAACCHLAVRRGVNVVVTNGPFDGLDEFYGFARRFEVDRRGALGADRGRGSHREFVFVAGPDVDRVDWSALEPAPTSIPLPLFAEAA